MLGKDFENWGLCFRYAVDETKLGSLLGQRFVPMSLDTEGEAFAVHALQHEHSPWKRRLHWMLTRFASDFDVNAWLDMHSVFLLSTPQALELLPGTTSQTLVDVGAGSGDVTTRLAALFDQVRCSEVSKGMARRLRQRGLPCFEGEVGSGSPGDPLAEPFDVVALCNVLDRCQRPNTLLQGIRERMQEDSRLLISCPLPYRPHYYRGGRTYEPEHPLKVTAEDFETAAEQLWQSELEPLGLELRAWSRMPYLSTGNDTAPLIALDTAVFVCGVRTPAVDVGPTCPPAAAAR